jgi:hypothetical protein
MPRTPRPAPWTGRLLAVVTAGCGPSTPYQPSSASTDEPSTSSADSATTDPTTISPSTGAPTTTADPDTTATAPDATTDIDALSTGSTAPVPDTTDTTAGFITGPTSDTDPGSQPNGSSCSENAECESLNCYVSPVTMVGVCGVCNEDKDCVDAGTGISCSEDPGDLMPFCAPGELGNQCMSEAACMPGLFCTPNIEGLEGFLANTCGECASSDDCPNGELCSPTLDNPNNAAGQKMCVPPGSLPQDALCPTTPADGDAACASMHCGDVDLMGFVPVPVCGECEVDSDCPMNETCFPGMFDGGGFFGATCE